MTQIVNLKKYLKYYFLEDYLFGEVNKNFKKRGYLTPEEFFAIIIWKSNRAKTNVRKGIKKSGKSIKTITSAVSKAKTLEQKLDILVSLPGIGIPMASAILTVCYPNDFTIADYRASASLKDFGETMDGNPTTSADVYFDYINQCKRLARKQDLSLRDFDRVLWARDFYEGTNGLKNLVVNCCVKHIKP